MSKVGILPIDAYQLTIAELNIFIRNRALHEVEISISSAWRTINFLGALLSDKLKNLDRYLPETPSRKKVDEAKKKKLEEDLSKIM